MATAFISRWKVNRALYRQYGGPIIFQQGRPEPLDASRAFLGNQQGQGAFRIPHESMANEFRKCYVIDSIHSFYPAGSREVAQAFETPRWLLKGMVQ